MPGTRNAIGILEKLTSSDRAVRTGIARAHANFEIAQVIYTARSQAGLSPIALAEAVGTKQSVIARLENANCPGAFTHDAATPGKPEGYAISAD